MKNNILKCITLIFILLLLPSCSSKQDFSIEIEKDVLSEFNKNNIDSEYHSPEIFKNCKTPEDYEIDVESDDSGTFIVPSGDITSIETKLNYSDIKIHILKNTQETLHSKDLEEMLSESVSLWSSESKIDFSKYSINNQSYYIAHSFVDKPENPVSIFNILSYNDNNLVLITGTLNESKEINQKTEEKICKDFSTIES